MSGGEDGDASAEDDRRVEVALEDEEEEIEDEGMQHHVHDEEEHQLSEHRDDNEEHSPQHRDGDEEEQRDDAEVKEEEEEEEEEVEIELEEAEEEEEEEEDRGVDEEVGDGEGDEQQHPSSDPGTFDPYPSAGSGEYSTAATSTQLNTENGAESEALVSPASPSQVASIVSPRGKPIPSVENISEVRGSAEVTPETRGVEEKTSTVEAVLVDATDVYEDTPVAGVLNIPARVSDVSTTQEICKSEVKVIDVELVSGSEIIVGELEPVNEQSQSTEHPSSMDIETTDDELRKNSMQDGNVKGGEETQTPKADTSAIGLLNLANQASEDAQEPKQTGTEHDAHITSKLDQPEAYGEDGLLDSADAHEIRGADLEPEKAIESSSDTNHDPNAFSGLNALTVAIDSVNAQDELAQLQPKLDNGIEGNETSTSTSAQRQREKTELEREMELFEAAEREEEARLLASMRSDQSLQGDSVDGTLKDMLNDRKRALDSSPNEARKKRGKRVLTLSEDAKEEEDVCFICFDGGDLVLCDRRTCPKAYHLNCIGRDAAFFQKKGAWICGWHFCSICTKPANFQCYTCPTAYCNACLNKADFLCVRQRKGLCEECWPIVKMIEHNESVNAEGVEVDFTDQETYECLFKDYWENLKLRLSLTPDELDKDAKGAGGSGAFLDAVGSDGEDKLDAEDYSTGTDDGPDDDDEDMEEADEEKKKKMLRKRRIKKGKAKDLPPEEEEHDGDVEVDSESGNEEEDMVEDVVDDGDEEDGEEDDVETMPDAEPREFEGWASKELTDFVKFMDEDPKKPLSRFQITKLLWSYIKSQNLVDHKKKKQIKCDERLQTIFGKKTVGQFEIYKHLQPHFAPKASKRLSRQVRDEQTSMDVDLIDADGGGLDEKVAKVKDVKDKRRRKKTDEDKFERPNVNEFAAVTPKNIGLIYLRRQLLEELLDDPEFDIKVCNTFVRIRVPGMISKSEMCYRLVQVVGTRLQDEHYKAGRKTTNIVLEILNLQKREDVTVDLVSNHDFTEEECQRLRQSIKCGFIKTLTVGDIEEKAKDLQAAKVNDWFETERQRLVNLRDRASEKGRKKELRECVEKLQELSSPAFRAAKLLARPEVTADPRMDPNYESDGNDDKSNVKGGMPNILDKNSSPGFGDKTLPVSILKNSYNESGRVDWDTQRSKHTSWADTNRSKDGDRMYEPVRSSDKLSYGRAQHYGVESAGDRGYEERWEKDWSMEQRDGGAEIGWMGNGRNRSTSEKWNEKVEMIPSVDTRLPRNEYRGGTGMTTPVFDTKPDWGGRREPAPPLPSVQGFPITTQTVLTQAAIEAAEKEKIWHYTDPTGTVQGPFAMEQLRKWNTTGYFPEDLRIWKTTQPRDESILLTDGLAGRFHKEREPWSSVSRPANPVVASIQEEIAQALNSTSTLGLYNNSHPTLKSGGPWRENGGANTWSERGSGDLGRSSSWGLEGNQSSRPLVRDVSGLSAPFRDTGSDMKWKTGPAAGSYDSYGRSSYGNSPTRTGRAEAAARFDPANWGSRSTSVRPERDGWSSPTPGNDGGGYSKSGGRSSWGRGSHHRDSGGGWNPDESGGHDSTRSRGSRASKKDIPCRFHQKGYCKRGDSCDFWHG